MKKAGSKTLMISFGVVAAATVLATGFLAMPTSLISSAETSRAVAYSENLSVVAHKDATTTETGTRSSVTLINGGNTISNYQARSFDWENIKFFELSFNPSALPNDLASYSYSYSVTWAPQTIEDNKVDFNKEYASTKTIVSENNVAKEDVKTKINFLIDDNVMEGENNFTASKTAMKDNEAYNITFGGWGTYLFSFECNGVSSSAVYELKPTDPTTLEEPKLIVKENGISNAGKGSKYVVSVDEKYKFVNRQLIKWSISGKDRDGKEYVLAPADKEIAGNQDKATIEPNDAVVRTGLSFNFDPKREGTWTISCDILDAPNGTSVKNAKTEQISTIEGFSSSSIIWIIVGCAAAVAIIVTVIVVVRVKKEKVY